MSIFVYIPILFIISRSNFKRSQLCRIISTTPASILNVSAISHAFETFPKIKLSPSPPPCNLLSLLRIHNFETFPSFTKRKKERKVKIKKLDPASAIIRIVPFASPPLNFLDRYRDDLQKFSGRDRLSSDRLKQLSGCFVPRRVHEASKHGQFPPMGYPPS